jgi:LysM repeat protein
VDGYFKQYPIPGTIYAKDVVIKKLTSQVVISAKQHKVKQHKVVRGDTLSAISKRYRVSIYAIKRANKMSNNTLYIGKVLSIP